MTDTHPYSLRQLEQMIGLTARVISTLIAAGFVTPQRGARNAYRFSFQDVVLLRTAHKLRQAKIPKRRLLRSLKELKAKLPDEMPLSGLRIKVIGNQVAVRDSAAQWEDTSGQLVMDFEWSTSAGGTIHQGHFVGAPSAAISSITSVPESSVGAPSAAISSHAKAAIATEGAPKEVRDAKAIAAVLYDLALQQESGGRLGEAEATYRRLLEVAPSQTDAAINLAALLCEAGRCADALAVCDQAVAAGGDGSALLHFNRAIALEDLPRREHDALRAYQRSLELDPALADAHYNLGRLHEKHGRKQAALRHFSAYRRLQRR
ncbi:MAG: tetratricopeptide repeat protein [Ideonella sp.]